MVRILKEMPGLTAKLSRTFSDLSCTAFRLSPYVVSTKADNGLLVFTTLTCALLHIDSVFSEDELCRKAKEDPELRKTLLLHRVLIPENFDEQKFCEQLRVLLLSEKNRLLRGRKNGYIIFTTTACNARCYYCFEHGYVPVTMTEETARKAAEYIEAHANGEVTLTWFGGEPLVNTKAIDSITAYLAERGISFRSHIVTNAWLFTPELIQRAKKQWHLENAQITLDGTRENYNRIKAYVNGDADDYSRVLGNIKALAENDVHISLYLVLSRENEEDLYALLTELAPMMKENPERFSVLPNLLQQYGGAADEDEMQQKLIGMWKWLRINGMLPEPKLPQNLCLSSCTADNPGTVVIQADGGLHCCDHIGESRPYGSVFEEDMDKAVIRWWAERRAAIPDCDGCALYPQCLRLAHCPAKKFACTKLTREDRISSIKAAMKNVTVHSVHSNWKTPMNTVQPPEKVYV